MAKKQTLTERVDMIEERLVSVANSVLANNEEIGECCRCHTSTEDVTKTVDSLSRDVASLANRILDHKEDITTLRRAIEEHCRCHESTSEMSKTVDKLRREVDCLRKGHDWREDKRTVSDTGTLIEVTWWCPQCYEYTSSVFKIGRRTTKEIAAWRAQLRKEQR